MSLILNLPLVRPKAFLVKLVTAFEDNEGFEESILQV